MKYNSLFSHLRSWISLHLLTILVASCGPDPFPEELVSFEAAQGNPVFSGTDSSTWDSKIRERGYILKEDSVYKMWYTGYSDNDPVMKIGLALSNDGIGWNRHPDNPVIDSFWTEDVHVVVHDGVYYMVAEGLNDIAYMLSSSTGIDWTSLGPLDIRKSNGDPIEPGPRGTPTLWIEGDQWYLFYEREDIGIWLAVSSDRKTWINLQDTPVIKKGPESYDSEGVALNQVIKVNQRYYALYHGTPNKDWSTWNSNIAVSKDLVRWEKYSQNPIVRSDSLNPDLSSPILIHDGHCYRLYTMHEKVRVYFPK